MSIMGPGRWRRGQKRTQPRKQKTVQFKKFRGVNRTDARVAIDDDELYWLENAIPVGNGAVQIVPGSGTSIATISNARTIWGASLNGNAVALVVGSDGSITQVTIPGGVTTVV